MITIVNLTLPLLNNLRNIRGENNGKFPAGYTAAKTTRLWTLGIEDRKNFTSIITIHHYWYY